MHIQSIRVYSNEMENHQFSFDQYICVAERIIFTEALVLHITHTHLNNCRKGERFTQPINNNNNDIFFPVILIDRPNHIDIWLKGEFNYWRFAILESNKRITQSGALIILCSRSFFLLYRYIGKMYLDLIAKNFQYAFFIEKTQFLVDPVLFQMKICIVLLPIAVEFVYLHRECKWRGWWMMIFR